MNLLLEIISHQRHSMTEEQSQFVFSTAGGTIGRNQDNDWLIDDPERLISGRHALIQFEHNQFIISDSSTNGLFVNNDQQALGERHHIVSNGDIFLLGQFSLQATLISTQSKAVFSSSICNTNIHNSQPSVNTHEISNSSLINHNSANDASVPLFPHELPINSSQLVDPLSQFNDGLIPGRLQEQDILAENDPINSILDPIPSTQSYFDLPNAIPENWLKKEPSHIETIQKTSTVDQAQGIKSNDKEFHIPNKTHDDMKASKSNDLVTNNVGDFEDFKKDFSILSPDAELNANKLAVNESIESKLIQNKSSDTAESRIENLHKDELSSMSNCDNRNGNVHKDAMNNLLLHLGIDPGQINDEELPELSKNIALITKNSMTGMMKTMVSRAHLKNEFRMSMTTIQTQENNPLKFCINYEQLVHYMLVKPMKGYLDSERAVKESFDELQEHQVGVMAGMKSSLKYMLDKLSPEKIVEYSNKNKSLGLGSKKSRYWDAYAEIYNSINEEDDVFTTLFGNEFCKAYEQQIENIRQARK
ncbi:MAG: type VI secretion system-associated FHA domain protein TagH [Gammaproteobacteria bacterium]|nr:type VI secretion system-associated FHA domain protein TagH [Gammaproteobacteria bacterium]